jgi:SAM-dependent methyltransferase
VHYRRIAEDISAYVPAGASVLDYGCGEALHAGIVAAHASRLILCEAAAQLRAALQRRFTADRNIEVRSPEEVGRLPAGSIDVIVLHSVAQYLTPAELEELLGGFRRLLAPAGLLLIGDVVPTHVSAATDALALLRFGAAGGFLAAALVGLVRTVASDYWRLRSRLGLTRYSEEAMREKLALAGFAARRAKANIGHNRARMTFLARPL